MKRATLQADRPALRPRISIHALVKRATNFYLGNTVDKCHFNPRPREEGDSNARPVSAGRGHFNPRPREEGDCLMSILINMLRYFNPRPREEGDCRRGWCVRTEVDFNPRPREEGDA